MPILPYLFSLFSSFRLLVPAENEVLVGGDDKGIHTYSVGGDKLTPGPVLNQHQNTITKVCLGEDNAVSGAVGHSQRQCVRQQIFVHLQRANSNESASEHKYQGTLGGGQCTVW